MISAAAVPLVVTSLFLAGAATLQDEPAATGAGGEDPIATANLDTGPIELTVEQAVTIALGNNLAIEIAEVNTEVARFDQLGSWGAFNWVFDARLTGTDRTQEGSGFLSGGQETSTETISGVLDFRKPLTTGGSFAFHFDTLDRLTDNAFFDEPRQREGNISMSYIQPLRRGAWSEYATALQRESEILFMRQREVARATRQAIAFQVYNAYWDLVSAIEQQGVADSAIDLGKNRLEQNRRQYEAGVGTEVEVLQAQAELATREETLIQARNNVAQREDELKRLLFAGEDDAVWDVFVKPSTPLPTETDADVPAWTVALATALEWRSELRQKTYDVDVARLRATRAASERLAAVDLELSAGSGAVDTSRSDTISKAAEFRYPTYSASLVYSLPIGNDTAIYAERAARAAIRAALLDYDSVELDITAEVREAVRGVRYASEQVRATSTSLALARRQLEAEEARFNNDLSTTFQVLEFQQDLVDAMANERTARVAYAKALINLESVQGLLAESRGR